MSEELFSRVLHLDDSLDAGEVYGVVVAIRDKEWVQGDYSELDLGIRGQGSLQEI